MKLGWKTWQELKTKVNKLIIERLTIGQGRTFQHIDHIL